MDAITKLSQAYIDVELQPADLQRFREQLKTTDARFRHLAEFRLGTASAKKAVMDLLRTIDKVMQGVTAQLEQQQQQRRQPKQPKQKQPQLEQPAEQSPPPPQHQPPPPPHQQQQSHQQQQPAGQQEEGLGEQPQQPQQPQPWCLLPWLSQSLLPRLLHSCQAAWLCLTGPSRSTRQLQQWQQWLKEDVEAVERERANLLPQPWLRNYEKLPDVCVTNDAACDELKQALEAAAAAGQTAQQGTSAAQRPPVVQLVGLGGMGKTTAALQVALALEKGQQTPRHDRKRLPVL